MPETTAEAHVIRLYFMPGAASLAPHGVLEEAGAEYELVRVVREEGRVVEPPDYATINPHLRVPALVDGDLVLYESAAIVMHLCDRFPAAGLAPAVGTSERGDWYRWLVHLTNTVQVAFLEYFGPGRAVSGDEAEQALVTGATARLESSRDWLEAELAGRGGTLLPGRFSSADLFLAMLTRWGRRLDEPWWNLPNLGAHYRRVVERPAIRRVYERQGLEE